MGLLLSLWSSIPEVPCFAGDVKATSSVSTIIDFQYRSLCRGKDSIFGMLEAQGINPRDYVTVFNLRIYDRSELARCCSFASR